MATKLCNYCSSPAVRIIPYPRGRFLDPGYLSLCREHATYISVNDRGEIQCDKELRQALIDEWTKKRGNQ